MPDNRQQSLKTLPNLPSECVQGVRRLKIGDNSEADVTRSSSYPDRPGEPNCVYYLRTGSCGYGDNCRYNHPSIFAKPILYRGDLPRRIEQPDFYTGTCCEPVQLNILGFPIRENEKPCRYYMRTSFCKFGAWCKFNHPPPLISGASSATDLPPWTSPEAPFVVIPTVPVLYSFVSSPTFPERPDQPDCRHYLNTGSCKYGSDCRFNHPKERVPQSGEIIGPLGLPLRPGQPMCLYYARYGLCKYGMFCKFDHPVGGFWYHN